MKTFLTVTAVIEVGAGLALVVLPSATAEILLGSSLVTLVALTVGRLAGLALLVLGVVCWIARQEEQSRVATGLVAAMLLYNLAAVALLASAGIGSGPVGIVLWLAVVVHVGMAVWCIACLRIKRVM